MALSWLLLTVLPVIIQAIQVADPGGKYGVGFRQHIIPHHTPDEPVPAPNKTGTFLLMSVYYPTESKRTGPGPYFDPTSAKIFEKLLHFPTGSLQSLKTELQLEAPFLAEEATKSLALPTVVFQPGLGNSAFMYYGLLSNLASNGYTVLALDHPYEPPALLLPNGTTILGASYEFDWSIKQLSEIEGYRISDVKAAVAAFPEYAANVSAPFNTSHFFTIGHSMGGAAAASATAEIPSSLGGINFDGAYWPPYYPDVRKPFLHMGSINNTWQFDYTLPKFFEKQTGWWDVPVLYGTYHNDYSDMGVWPQLLGIKWNTLLSDNQIGPIGGSRATQIVRAFVMQFFDFVLNGEEGILLNPSPEWWEVIHLNGSALHRPPYIEG